MFTTIPQGQRAAVWGRDGRAQMIDGPRRVWSVGRRVEMLERQVAGPTQYLVVRHRDGVIQHLRGPVALWIDPVRHESVEVAEAIPLDANQAVIVYRQENESSVTRRIVHGPDLFVPEAREWLHTFNWHGADPRDHTKKQPRALQFTKLRIIPDQMYFNVEEVRTADDALIEVRLMIFFELVDIEKMLDQTHDVVGDFINAVSADVIDFTAANTFDQFKEKTASLSLLDTYPHLLSRAGRIGYTINKVVYRGYHASSKLQAMHDGAIEARTQLRLAAETEEQAQQLADLKLERESARAIQQREMEEADLHHRNHLARLQHEEQLRLRQSRREARLADTRARNQEQLAFLGAIAALRVDLTRYLVAQHEHPDRFIRVEGNGTSRLHVHD